MSLLIQREFNAQAVLEKYQYEIGMLSDSLRSGDLTAETAQLKAQRVREILQEIEKVKIENQII